MCDVWGVFQIVGDDPLIKGYAPLSENKKMDPPLVPSSEQSLSNHFRVVLASHLLLKLWLTSTV